jgi:tRNA (adenine37-N6)-methyltransferase
MYGRPRYAPLHRPGCRNQAVPPTVRGSPATVADGRKKRMKAAAFEPIGHLETPHRDPHSVPSQASVSPTLARIVVDRRFIEGLLGLERYEHLWIITWLDRLPHDRPLRIVPRATEATGEVQGVFASRSPVRPCGIGLSLVQRIAVADNVVTIRGVDLLDETPVLDIKPWFADCDEPRSLDR